MAGIVDTLITKFVLDDQYSAKLRAIGATTMSVGNQINKSISKQTGGMDSMMSAFKGVGSVVTTVLGTVTAAVAAVGVAVYGITEFADKALNTFAKYDSIERIFTGIYHSTKLAKQQMSYLNVEAQKGMFTFEALATSASKLTMMGLQFSKYKTAIQGIAIRMGGGDDKLMEATDALARIQGGETGRGFRTLREGGMGMAEMQKLGAVFDKSGEFKGNTEQAVELFKKLGDSSQDIVKTFEGSPAAMMANIHESLTRVMAAAGEGIFSSISGGIGQIVNAINVAIDSGAIKNTFSAIINLFSADAKDISLTSVIASMLAGVQTAAAFVKVVWDGIQTMLNNPIVKGLMWITGMGTGGLYGSLVMPDMEKIYQNSYSHNMATMEHYSSKKHDFTEPINPKATEAIATPLAAIEEHTKSIKERMKDVTRHVFGGGDRGRAGISAVDIHNGRGGAGGKTVNVKVENVGDLSGLLEAFTNQAIKKLIQQGVIRAN